MNLALEFNPVPKSQQLSKTRIKPTQRQLGEISPKVDKQLKERSEGICELCTAAKAVQRAHITGRKQIDHKTTADDLLHVCVPCHIWLDQSVEGIKYKRNLAAPVSLGDSVALRAQAQNQKKGSLQMADELKMLKKQVKEYERALKWYANSQHYHIEDQHGYRAIENDEGEQARNILRRWNER